MKVTLQVKTNAKVNRVEMGPGGEFRVQVKSPPQEGRANEAVIQVLAEYYKVPKSCVSIVKGFRSKHKTVIIASKS